MLFAFGMSQSTQKLFGQPIPDIKKLSTQFIGYFIYYAQNNMTSSLKLVVAFQNPGYMKDAFFISVETLHIPGDGELENVSGVVPELAACLCSV